MKFYLNKKKRGGGGVLAILKGGGTTSFGVVLTRVLEVLTIAERDHKRFPPFQRGDANILPF